MKHWFPKRRPKIIMRENIFEQDEQRTAFYQRLMDAYAKQLGEKSD